MLMGLFLLFGETNGFYDLSTKRVLWVLFSLSVTQFNIFF